MKKCPKCCKTKPLKEFYHRRNRPFGRQHYCKKCQCIVHKKWVQEHSKHCKEYIQQWYRKNSEHVAHVTRRRKYNIKSEEYISLLKKQKGVCAICHRPEIRIRCGKITALCVDHDHTTKRVRGLLCYCCNNMIGWVKDNPTLLKAAIKYLKTRGLNKENP